MALRVLVGSLVGWLFFFMAIGLLFGFGEEAETVKVQLFLSMAPGVIVGIVIAYVTSKKNKTTSEEEADSKPLGEPSLPERSVAEQLLEWKKLKDSGLLSEEEFAEIKRELLSKQF